MIQKLIMINSANFNFLEVDLQKDLFFLGDNGSGKTTAIRAIHYLFSGNVRNLGIPSDKDGFKEYYFKYANSYMVFVFEDFFIFMYKAGGEIVKIFSKQKFDMSRVLNEERTLNELSDIRRYAKEPNLHKTVRSLNEYREIIYGNNKQLLDFKFTHIKNNETFLGLFNEIFNIDKSIIDAKSIKRAIQTTLDYEKKVIDFNHEDYLQKIYGFKNEYKFFREFEKQKQTIDDAYEIKESLLRLEEEIIGLKEFMLYRVSFESEELNKMTQISLEIDKKLSKTKEYHKRSERIFARCAQNFRDKRDSLELEIKRVGLLKVKFSESELLRYRDRADRYTEIIDREKKLNESYIKLKSGFENELENIAKEISSLEYIRDKLLVREFENRQYNQTQLLLAELNESIEKENLTFETKQDKSILDEKELRGEMIEFEKNRQYKKLLVIDIEEKLNKEKKRVRETYEKDVEKCKLEIKRKDGFIEDKHRAIKNLKLDSEDLESVYKRDVAENEQNYLRELKGQEIKIQKYQNMMHSKPSSFKEFLNEEVDGWERELYPLIDDVLLDMSVEELQPKIVSQTELFGIELEKKSLKQILTRQEAETKIESLNLQIVSLKSSYKEASLKRFKQYEENQEKLRQRESFAFQEIEILQSEIIEIQTVMETLRDEYVQAVQNIEDTFKIEKKQIENDIESLQEEIDNSLELIQKLHKELQGKKIALVNRIKDLREIHEERVKEEHKKLKLSLAQERQAIDKKIAHQEEQKLKITKDERVKELEDNLKDIKKEITDSLLAKEYLLEYEKCKQDIALLLQKKNSLENMKLKNDEFKKRLENKIENYKYTKDALEKEKKVQVVREKNLKKGCEVFSLIASEVFEDVSSKESDEYLYVLIEHYNDINSEHKNRKIDFKEKLEKLNSLKNSQNEIEINFKFDAFNESFFISQTPNILIMLDDIFEFKNKKLEMVKSSGHNRFRSFVNSEMPTKMSIFNDGEDKFISQVKKINKNLSSIDFGVIKNIRIETKVGEKKSIAKLLNELSINVANLSSLLSEESLFYDKDEVLVELNHLEMKFKEIKQELKGSAISLQDTIDLSLSFNENGKEIEQVSQLKNESSTGGSMLLKIAIAVSILKLFIKEDETPFFLIVDEVSRLHSHNQEKLRAFANSKGFGIVFVTPEPTYSKPEAIKYYRFRKNLDDEFEAIELNL